jgi:hypothetical protein
MYDVTEQHKAEVRQGERFEFGKNWSRFLTTLNDERIELATSAAVADYSRLLRVGSALRCTRSITIQSP